VRLQQLSHAGAANRLLFAVFQKQEAAAAEQVLELVSCCVVAKQKLSALCEKMEPKNGENRKM
jgi:hypothetical protein